MRTLALLTFWQLKNALRTTLTEPKKLIPALVFVGIIGMQTAISLAAGPRDQVSPEMLTDALAKYGPIVHGAVFLLLALISLAFLETGFSGRALTFSMADIDYLFPSPIPRRAVLAYHIPTLILKQVWQAGFFVWFGYYMLWRSVGAENLHGGSAWVVFAALLAWMAGYACLSIAIQVVWSRGRATVARQATLVVVAALLAWAAFLIWRHGIAGLVYVEQSLVLRTAFFPSRLMADALMTPVTGGDAMGALLTLAGFFALALALVLTRRENFYETSLPHSERIARVRQAARTGNIGALLALRSRAPDNEKEGRGAERKRTYAVPPFGRGAVAVLWANLSAAAKRPIPNYLGPIAGGLALSIGARVWGDREAAFLVLGVVGYVTYIMLIVGSRNAFRQFVERFPLIRPLPIAPFGIVLAETLPVAMSASLFALSASLPLAVLPRDAMGLVSGILAFPVPVVLLDLCLLGYTVTLWYPLMQDKMQQLIGGLVSMALLGVFAAGLSPFIAVPLLLGAAPATTVALTTLGALILAVPLAVLATGALRGLSPA